MNRTVESVSTEEDKRTRAVVAIGIKTAVGLRRSMSRNGIRQIPDFVNGMIFAGVLLQKNLAPGESEKSFSWILSSRIKSFVSEMRKMDILSDLDEIRRHEIGEIEETPTEMLITAGMSAEKTIEVIAGDCDLDAEEALEVVVVVILAAMMSGGEKSLEKMDDIIEDARIKIDMWNNMIPSDEEMFGPEED